MMNMCGINKIMSNTPPQTWDRDRSSSSLLTFQTFQRNCADLSGFRADIDILPPSFVLGTPSFDTKFALD
jgi:hypothetical protein